MFKNNFVSLIFSLVGVIIITMGYSEKGKDNVKLPMCLGDPEMGYYSTLSQITKMGHIFLLDRETGRRVYPIEEILVPVSLIKKEETAWATQFLPKILFPYTTQALEESDLNTLSPDYDSMFMVFKNAVKGIYHPFSDVLALMNPGLNGDEWGGEAFDQDCIMYANGNGVPWININTPKTDLSLGELIYVDNCSKCHGKDRKGNPASGFPTLENIGSKYQRSYVEEIIVQGIGYMPGFPELSRSEKKALVIYLFNEESEGQEPKNDRQLYENANGVPWIDTLHPNAPKIDLNLGELMYLDNCSTCHGGDRKGNPVSGFPTLKNIGNKFQRSYIEEIIVNGKDMMPGFPEMSRSEKMALVNYLFN